MVLRNSVTVTRYMYVDHSARARRAAVHRMQQLHALYPDQFSIEAYKHALTTLPHDVWDITEDDLHFAGAADGQQWLVVAGWDCTDLSLAGKGQGFYGTKSRTFYPCMQILSWLQQAQTSRPPGYLLENVALHLNARSTLVQNHAAPVVLHALSPS